MALIESDLNLAAHAPPSVLARRLKKRLPLAASCGLPWCPLPSLVAAAMAASEQSLRRSSSSAADRVEGEGEGHGAEEPGRSGDCEAGREWNSGRPAGRNRGSKRLLL